MTIETPQQPLSTETTNRREMLIGYFIALNGLLFAALGFFLILQTGAWQASVFIGLKSIKRRRAHNRFVS